VGPGVVWLQLALDRTDALVDATADKLINRHVRPLLRALTRASSVPASYFGRDWISAAHRPIALVSFAHDGTSGAALFEAIVGVSAPFSLAQRPSFLGKRPATLEEVSERSVAPAAVVDAIVEAYRALASETRDGQAEPVEPLAAAPDSAPWSAHREEAIGTIAAGRDASGRLRLGGELMASRDAVARLEALVAALPPGASADQVGDAVDRALTTGGAVVFGVRSLASIRDAIVDALR
jgi:hypothetical protein